MLPLPEWQIQGVSSNGPKGILMPHGVKVIEAAVRKAPDMADRGIANCVGKIRYGAIMLEHREYAMTAL